MRFESECKLCLISNAIQEGIKRIESWLVNLWKANLFELHVYFKAKDRQDTHTGWSEIVFKAKNTLVWKKITRNRKYVYFQVYSIYIVLNEEKVFPFLTWYGYHIGQFIWFCLMSRTIKIPGKIFASLFPRRIAWYDTTGPWHLADLWLSISNISLEIKKNQMILLIVL